jgi:hypothetical protein
MTDRLRTALQAAAMVALLITAIRGALAGEMGVAVAALLGMAAIAL